MENNHILIGLVVLTISCIYLFYLNYTKHSDFEKLSQEVNYLKTINKTNYEKLESLSNTKQLPSYGENKDLPLSNNEIQEINNLNINKDPLQYNNDKHILEEKPLIENIPLVEETDLSDDTEPVEEMPLIENIPLVEETDLSDDTEPVEEMPLIEHIPLVEETTLFDEKELIEETTLFDEKELVEETLNDDLIFDTLDIDNDLELNLENHNDTNNDKLEYNIGVDNLDTMTLKELKLICKNINIKTKGNKDEIICKIKDSLKT
jgi:hypothetical protein